VLYRFDSLQDVLYRFDSLQDVLYRINNLHWCYNPVLLRDFRVAPRGGW
jgi:hypothetical protein